MKENGVFIMSLDLELFWGVRDVTTIEKYGKNIANVHKYFPEMMELYRDYGLKATFATVGFLFAKNKSEIVRYSPEVKPEYEDKAFSPYEDNFKYLKEGIEDPYHYGLNLIKLLKEYSEHEIATHTFCHYYCLESGQTTEAFKNDLESAISIARNNDVIFKSIVFPRNQYNFDYIEICRQLGITSYRGLGNSWYGQSGPEKDTALWRKVIRTVDCYINIFGYKSYPLSQIKRQIPYDIPGSLFLKPYNSKGGRVLEKLKLRRIKKEMTNAAKKRKIFHLWWHPHNFGSNTKQNLDSLRSIFEHYQYLNKVYGFENKTMSDLSSKLIAHGDNKELN